MAKEGSIGEKLLLWCIRRYLALVLLQMEADLLSTPKVPNELRRIVLLFGSSSSIQPVPPNDQQDGLFLLADVVVPLAVHAVARPPLQTEKKKAHQGGGERISGRSLTGLNPGSCRYRYRTCTLCVSESEPITQVPIHICAATSISAMDAAAKHRQWHFV